MAEDVLFKDIGGNDDIDFNQFSSDCYGIRIEKDKVSFTCNNKVVLQLDKDAFPSYIDFDSVETLGNLLETVRKEGLSFLVEKLSLPATT